MDSSILQKVLFFLLCEIVFIYELEEIQKEQVYYYLVYGYIL